MFSYILTVISAAYITELREMEEQTHAVFVVLGEGLDPSTLASLGNFAISK